MNMNIKHKMEIDRVVLDLSHEEALDLCTILHDYVDYVEDYAIEECYDGLVDMAKKLLKGLDNLY